MELLTNWVGISNMERKHVFKSSEGAVCLIIRYTCKLINQACQGSIPTSIYAKVQRQQRAKQAELQEHRLASCCGLYSRPTCCHAPSTRGNCHNKQPQLKSTLATGHVHVSVSSSEGGPLVRAPMVAVKSFALGFASERLQIVCKVCIGFEAR